MSEAIKAKSARARASIAIRKMKRRQTSGRSFSDCFEMGDGDDVIVEILKRAETDAEIESCYPHVAEWRKTFAHRMPEWTTKLKTETDTPEMEQRVVDAFVASCHARDPDEETYCAVFEHGQWWITCDQTGAQWSVVDAVGGRAIDGFDFECVSQGEED